MGKELKTCPFCGETEKIKYSIKRTGRFEVQYHAAMYCDICHTYGPRVLTPKIKRDDYKGRTAIENDPEIRKQAEAAWNIRKPIDKVVKQLEQEAELTHLNKMEERVGKKQTVGFALGIREAIEIVKGGGINEI